MKITIEGDEHVVLGVLAVLGAHSAATLAAQGAVVPPAPQTPPPVEQPPASPGPSPDWIKGRDLAAEVVEAWCVGWGDTEQPDRSPILQTLTRRAAGLTYLKLYLHTTDSPWEAVGASPEQAAHIAQVGSALQLLPAPS